MAEPFLEQFCRQFAENLCNGEGTAAAVACRPPLAVYHAGLVIIHVSAEEIAKAMLSWATAAQLIGTERIDVTLDGAVKLSDGRTSVNARWDYRNAMDVTVTRSALTCFLSTNEGGDYEIEMLEIQEMGFDGYPPTMPETGRPN